MENQLIDIQTRLTYQEDEIKHLNQTVTEQARQLDTLREELDRFKQLFRQLAPSQVGDIRDEPPPPHY